MIILPSIDSFLKVTFHEQQKPLVICDIDHTFIRPDIEFENALSFLRGIQPYEGPTFLYEHTIRFIESAYNAGFIRQSDPEGFQAMLQTIERLDGKLIFLTARSQMFHNKTVRDLMKAGLENPTRFEIHYTSNLVTKGQYLQNLGIVSQFEHVSFIDDNMLFIESVHSIFPHINCYQFKFKTG